MAKASPFLKNNTTSEELSTLCEAKTISQRDYISYKLIRPKGIIIIRTFLMRINQSNSH